MTPSDLSTSARQDAGQAEYPVRVDWGLDGLRAIAPGCGAIVIVDVLSFSTAVDVVTSRDARVMPLPWRGRRARRAAMRAHAVPAGSRGDDGYTLSPASLIDIEPATLRGLASPNGATLCHTAAELDTAVYAGCLRNASSVASAAIARADGWPIAVVAAGEQRRDTRSPRFAVEDQLGAGAIIRGLRVPDERCSAEARIAAESFGACPDLSWRVAGSVSARELRAWGFSADVGLAVETDVSTIAPLLDEGVLRADEGEWAA